MDLIVSSECPPTQAIIHWRSHQCRSFYAESQHHRGRSQEAAFESKEDVCHSSDAAASSGARTRRAPIVIVPALRIVYVENRRAASETVRAVLQKFFNATWLSCGEHVLRRNVSSSCFHWGRCSSACLPVVDPERTLFAFSFARDPVTRFYSGLRRHLQRSPFQANLSVFVSEQLEGRCFRGAIARDEHLQSQTTQLQAHLGSVSQQEQSHVGLDFVGDVADLKCSFAEMLLAANRSDTGASGRLRAVSTETLVSALAFLETNHLHQAEHPRDVNISRDIAAVRTPALDAQVMLAFAQDRTCLYGAAPPALHTERDQG